MRCSRLVSGFTLIEMILVIVIMGVLVTMVMQAGKHIVDTGKTEDTKQELDNLAKAIVGNRSLENNGTRSDFGYVGDVGALPPNLDALMANPSGYSTWKGPYIYNRFENSATDYKTDSWGVVYAFSGGTTITSTGSGSSIVRKLAPASSYLLLNSVAGNVLDLNSSPPGSVYKDSITINLTIPDGAGGLITKTSTTDAGGYFSFDSIPMGSQDIQIIYSPTSDTLRRFISVIPGSAPYDVYRIPSTAWTYSINGGGGGSGSGSIQYVGGTATTTGGDCDKFTFDITNTSGSPITISNMTVTWASPTAYYKEIKWAGDKVVEQENPRIGSGQLATFNNNKTIGAGSTVTLEIKGFKDSPTGGNDVNMSNTDMTITFSDGSTITFNTGTCI